MNQWLSPAPGITPYDPRVVAIAQRLKAGARDRIELARRLFEFVRDQIAYSVQVPFWAIEHYTPAATLSRGAGYCVQKAALLCSLARAVLIPARLGFADIINHQLPEYMLAVTGGKEIYYHCFVEWDLGEGWVKATPALDSALCARHGWKVVEFVPGQDLMLPATTLSGQPHVEYIRYRGHRPGVPLAEMLTAWREMDTKGVMKTWRAVAEQGWEAAGGEDA